MKTEIEIDVQDIDCLGIIAGVIAECGFQTQILWLIKFFRLR